MLNIRNNLIDAGYTKEEVEEAFQHDYSKESYGWVFEGYPEDATSLEGYLYGETYEFFTDDDVETIVGRLSRSLPKLSAKRTYKPNLPFMALICTKELPLRQ